MQSDEVAVIQPDGCNDLVVFSRKDERDEIRLTGWDRRPRLAHLKAETTVIGYRLCPGSIMPHREFQKEISDLKMLEDFIESEATHDPEFIHMIEALTLPGATVAQVARQNGTTTRTLQRQFCDLLLPSPDFWRLLGRARRAVQALPCCVPLSEIAYTYGYSDQAHMTREFVRWFGYAPAQLRKNKILIEEICQPGLGNWQNDGRLEIERLL